MYDGNTGGTRVELGLVMVTPLAAAALEAAGMVPADLLRRHQRGDWGEVKTEEAENNERWADEGAGAISVYTVAGSEIVVLSAAGEVTSISAPDQSGNLRGLILG